MDALATWSRIDDVHDGETWQVFRKGRGTGVIVLHEVPGITEDVVAFAERVVARGHTVWMPRLFGPLDGYGVRDAATDVRRFCIRREFAVFARGRASRVTTWLRSLARQLRTEAGGAGVGVVGMCFTGGFALAMLADGDVIAPVVAEPSLPVPFGLLPDRRAARRRDLGLAEEEAARLSDGSCAVLGLRYRADPLVGDRFATLRTLLGDRFLAVEFDGRGHSVLTADERPSAVLDVLDFLDARLDDAPALVRERDALTERAVRRVCGDVSGLDDVVVLPLPTASPPFDVELVVAHPLDRDEFRRVSRNVLRAVGVAPGIRLRQGP